MTYHLDHILVLSSNSFEVNLGDDVLDLLLKLIVEFLILDCSLVKLLREVLLSDSFVSQVVQLSYLSILNLSTVVASQDSYGLGCFVLAFFDLFEKVFLGSLILNLEHLGGAFVKDTV